MGVLEEVLLFVRLPRSIIMEDVVAAAAACEGAIAIAFVVINENKRTTVNRAVEILKIWLIVSIRELLRYKYLLLTFISVYINELLIPILDMVLITMY